MTPDEQLRSWVAGEPKHDPENDRCCPDFSCCVDGSLAPLEERERYFRLYLEGNWEEAEPMLMKFLTRMISKQFPGFDFYVTGGNKP